MYKNKYKNFKVHTKKSLLAILEENGIYSYFDGKNNIVEIGNDNALYLFLFRVNASYVDDEGNLRALVLSYEPSKASLYEGRKLRDKRGSTYELDPETGMILIDGGDVKLRQLPFGKYILDIQRNIEIQREEERRLEEERQREEEERRQLAISNPPKKGTNWWKVAAAFGGAILVGGIGYCLTQK